MERKRNFMPLSEKLRILNDMDNDMPSKEIFKKYKINKSILYKIKKNRDKILEYVCSSPDSPNTTKIRPPQYPEIEEKLYNWFLKERSKGNILNDKLLELKALHFAKELKLTNFKASQGYLNNFKKRHGICFKNIPEEKLPCDESVVKNSFEQILCDLNLIPEQVYFANETLLFYKNLEIKTLVADQEKHPPIITIIACCNATGTHKHDLMIIGKSKNPESFKNCDPIVYYRSSKNALPTKFLFVEWFSKDFIPKAKEHLRTKGLPPKGLLLVGHGTDVIIEGSDFKIMFFPPDMTSIIPLGQNIIKSIKLKYRKSLLLNLTTKPGIEITEKLKNISLKEVAYIIRQAWEDVSRSLILNTWKNLLPIDEFIPKLSFNQIEDESLLISLYRNIVSHNSYISDEEIINWAHGNDETLNDYEEDNVLTHYEEDEEIIKTELKTFDEVIDNMNNIIEWAEGGNLSVEDVLVLRRIREKALLKDCTN